MRLSLNVRTLVSKQHFSHTSSIQSVIFSSSYKFTCHLEGDRIHASVALKSSAGQNWFGFSPRDICLHEVSDHNFFSICQVKWRQFALYTRIRSYGYIGRQFWWHYSAAIEIFHSRYFGNKTAQTSTDKIFYTAYLPECCIDFPNYQMLCDNVRYLIDPRVIAISSQQSSRISWELWYLIIKIIFTPVSCWF